MIAFSAWLGGFAAWLGLSLITKIRFKHRIELFAAAAIWPLVILVHLGIYIKKAFNRENR
jgi:hypothetical protein